VSISRRGLLAAGLTVAVISSIGVGSMINASADDNADSPPAADAPATVPTDATDTDSTNTVAPGEDAPLDLPPVSTLPWGEPPHRMKVGRQGATSATLAATGASAARDDSDTSPTPEFGPKGHTTRTGALTEQETTVVPPPLPPTAYEPVNAKDVYYIYSVGKQTAQTDGVAASVMIGKPRVGPNDWHSLAEIAVQSADSQQVVEVGWTVDRATNGDDDPHLFVFSWVDGGPQCYNECGFVPAKGASIKPGDTLVSGTAKNFGVQHINGAWWIAYDTEWIGAFTDKQWNGKFTRSGLVQFFGEVAASSPQPCTEMGTGELGGSATAAKFGSVIYVNGPTVSLNVKNIGVSDEDTKIYNYYRFSDRTFRFGGPGRRDC
jgi:hypothetical protein